MCRYEPIVDYVSESGLKVEISFPPFSSFSCEFIEKAGVRGFEGLGREVRDLTETYRHDPFSCICCIEVERGPPMSLIVWEFPLFRDPFLGGGTESSEVVSSKEDGADERWFLGGTGQV